MSEQGTGSSQRGASSRSLNLQRLAGPAVLVLAAIVATAPLRIFGFSCGHDFDFHLSSWFDALHSWRQGILYPHWAPSPNFNAGEPRFVFYPPLTWMLGAALGALLPWRQVPCVLTFLLLLGIGLAVRRLARATLSDAPATLAGCCAVFAPYTLFTIFERSDYAELAGGIWIPLLLLLVLRDLRPPAAHARLLNGAAVPLAIVVAGAWLSNPTVGVMASYLLAALALAVASLARSWMPLARAGLSAALGLAVSAFYWLPAAWEQRWIAIAQVVSDPGTRIENSFLFARHANPALQLHDIELHKVSVLAVCMVALSLAAFLLARRRGVLSASKRWWTPIALLPPVVFLLQLPISLPLWDTLPKLRFLQFPWRWLVAVEAPMGLLLAAALWPRTARARKIGALLCGVFFLAFAGFAGKSFNQGCYPEDSVAGMWNSYVHHIGFDGTDEYAPRDADNSLVATNLPDACLVTDPRRKLGSGDPDETPDWSPDQGSCDATYAFTGGDDEHRRLHAAIPHPGFLVLRLRRYPAWNVRVNGRPAASAPGRDDGLMAVPVPAGAITLSIDWTTTPDVRAARWISALALLALLALLPLEHRSACTRLK